MISSNNITIDDVIDFWFDEQAKPFWYQKNDQFDHTLSSRFKTLLARAKLGECALWRESPIGRLAEIIVLDQFSRNIYRGTAKAFEADGQALALSQEAVKFSSLNNLTQAQRNFFTMPFMHSESLWVHEQAKPMFKQIADNPTQEFEQKHLSIIKQFGRYPHRNGILDRESTPAERQYLARPDAGF